MKLDTKGKEYNIEPVANDFYGILYLKSGFASRDTDTIDVYIPKDDINQVIVNYVDEKKHYLYMTVKS